MLDGVPPGGDIYLLKRVLMTIGDDAAERVLRHCVDALPPSGRVVVVEMIMPSGNKPSAAKTFDVLMMLANRGGRVRREDELRRVFARSGLEVDAIINTSSPNSIIVGKTIDG